MNAMLDAALEYAAHGWPAFPLSRVGEPISTEIVYSVATTDPAQVERWWSQYPDAPIGLATGVAFAVLDVDHPDLEGQGTADLPPVEVIGPQARTPSGGWHLYVRPCGIGRKIRFSKHCDWLDGRGYVIAPPSYRAAHPTKPEKAAGAYEWVAGGPWSELHNPPGPLVLAAARVATEPPDRPATAPPARAGAASAAGPWNPQGIFEMVATAPNGERNTRLHWAAWRIGLNVADGKATRRDADEACRQLEQIAGSIGLATGDRSEARNTIISGYNAGIARKGAA